MWSLKGLSNVQLYATVAGLSLLLLAGSFGGGYLLGARNESRHQVKEVTKTVYVPVREIQEVQVRNVERETKLQTDLTTASGRIRRLEKELASIPRDDRTIDQRVTGVLNEAITGGTPADPASVNADQSTTVTDLTDWALTAIAQYNELATRHNGLVDWVEDELIEPQRTEQ